MDGEYDNRGRPLARIPAHEADPTLPVPRNENQSQTVEVYRRHHGTIDVVLLNVQMAGVDGPQTLGTLQGINPEVRCCFMSGHTGDYSTEELLATGASRVLPKPFHSLDELARTLWQLANGEA